MSAFFAIWKRELRAYFLGPLAYVFLGVYLLLSGLATWNLARLFDTARVDMQPFFQFQPWLLAFFAAAIGMRLWSEDLRSRTADLYLTSPVSLTVVHLAKAAAGLTVLAAALISSFPYWIALTWLGSPDHGLIALSYVYLLLLGTVFLFVSMAWSATTRHQVIALVLSMSTNLLLLVLSLNLVTDGMRSLLPPSLTGWIRAYGMMDVLVSAWRGVFRLSDVFTLIAFAGILALAGITIMENRRSPGWSSSSARWGVAFVALLFLAFPLARNLTESGLSSARFDVTGYRLNTLSPGAKQIVQKLKEPIELTLYYSEDIGADYPDIRAHADRVEALLTSFAAQSGGKIRLRTINPEPFSAGEDEAVANGISAIPTEGVDPLYLGLSGRNLVDDVQSIRFLSPEQDDQLELSIAQLLASLDAPSRPTIGILSGIPALSPTGQTAATLQRQIEDQYAVRWLSPADYALPNSLDAIIIAQPPQLSLQTLYLLDQYILDGGHVLILTDPAPILHDRTDLPGRFVDWIGDWGIELSDDILADDTLGLPVTVQTASGVQTLQQPVFPGFGQAQFNTNDPLTAALQRTLNFGTPGWISANPTRGLTASDLITTTGTSARVPTQAYLDGDQTPSSVRRLMTPLNDTTSVGVRLTGKFPNRFPLRPDVDFPDDPVLSRLAQAEWQARPHLEGASEEGSVILIHDTDFLFDPFFTNPQNGSELADNAALILSVLDEFAGNPDLATLRARPPAIRPMTRVLDLRRAAEADYIAEETTLQDELADLESALDTASDETRPAAQAAFLDARKSLRALQADFRQKLDSLETWLRWWTLWCPVLLAFLMSGLIRFIGRRRP
ncbi:MAG: hypothetical protein CMK07_03825 [Ponticaulis sp.]|nr:hypothetical protein [Ponticaulis sp.]